MVQCYQLPKVKSNKFLGGWKWCEAYVCVFAGYGQLLLLFLMAIASCCICVGCMFPSVVFLAQML